MGIGKVKGKTIRFSKPVIDILTAIGINGIQTYSELRTTHLSSYSRQYTWLFMKRLVYAGHLEEVLSENGSILGWILSRKGRVHLTKLIPEKSNQILKSPHYSSSFRHDSLLRRVHSIFKKSPALEDWTPEWTIRAQTLKNFSMLNSEERKNHLINLPDSILKIKSPHFTGNISLELELTQKNYRRLFQRFEAQVLSDAFSFVLYIVESDALKTKLRKMYQRTLETSKRIKMREKRNGIYFCELSEFLSKELSAVFEGLNSSFMFSQL